MFEGFSTGLWALVAGVATLAILSPGPDLALTVRNSLQFGRRAGLATALGIALGNGVHGAYTVLGLSVMLLALPGALDVLRVAGALYLGSLGALILWQVFRPSEPSEKEAPSRASAKGEAAGRGLRRALFTGFLVNITNVKATLFYVSLFSQVLTPTAGLGTRIVYAGTVLVLAGVLFSMIALVASTPHIAERLANSGAIVELVFGFLFIALAIALLLAP